MIIKNNKRTNIIYKGNNVVQRIYKGTSKTYEYLPKNYMECEYLQNNGSCYIDTGIIPNDYSGNYSVELTTQFTSYASNNSTYIFGVSNTGGRSCNVYTGTVGQLGVQNGDSTSVISASLTAEQADVLNKNTYKIKLVNNGLSSMTKDGTEYKNTTNSTTTSSYSLYLFKARFGSVVTGLKVFSCKIWDNNNNLVRYFIPCLDNNNVPCLYDLIKKTTYYNEGSGTFDYKLKDLPSNYTQCKYIEATGTQYIKTNYKPNSNTKIDINFSIPSTYPAFMCIYGTQDSGSSNRFYCGISLTNYRFQVNFTNTSSFYGLNEDDTISPNVNGTFSSVAGNMKVILNNTDVQVESSNYTNTYSMSSVSGWGNITCSYDLALFGRNTTGTIGNLFYGKLYNCKIYEGYHLKRHFIPCLDDNDTPCLYDTVTKTTFYNQGSGTFAYELL